MSKITTLSGLIGTNGDLTVDTDTLYVDSTNNRVGIGTDSPATALDVDGSVTADAISLNPTTGYANIEMGGPDGSYIDLKSPFSDDYDGRIITTGTDLNITTGSGSGSVVLQHENASKLSTTATGVDVTGVAKTSLGFQFGNSYLYEGATDQVNMRIGTDGPYLEFIDAGSGIAEVGNSSGPLALTASGTERARLETDGDLHVDGNVIAYSTTISDIRLKKDIAPIEDAVTKVQQLNGCTFTYLKDDRKSAGLIAQDVEKVLPSAVIEDKPVFHGEEGETYKTVQYDQVIGLLVEAVKELKAEIEELKNGSSN
jgi:hypothetical protein